MLHGLDVGKNSQTKLRRTKELGTRTWYKAVEDIRNVGVPNLINYDREHAGMNDAACRLNCRLNCTPLDDSL